MEGKSNVAKTCEFKPICPTTNFWVDEKADYIKNVCNTVECNICLTRQDFMSERITEGSLEWQRRVKYYEERRRQFPSHGIMEVRP